MIILAGLTLVGCGNSNNSNMGTELPKLDPLAFDEHLELVSVATYQDTNVTNPTV